MTHFLICQIIHNSIYYLFILFPQPVKKKPAEGAGEAPPTEKPKSAPPKKTPVATVAASGGGAKGKGKGKGKKGGGAGPMMEPPDQPEPNIAVRKL